MILPRPIRTPVTVLLMALTALAAIPTVVRLVGDHERKPLVLLVVGLPYAVVPLVLLLAVQVLLRRTKLAVVTAVAVALNVGWLAPLYVANAVPEGRDLTVMTANLKFGQADAAHLVQTLKDHHVDVLATEELTPEEVARLDAAGLHAVLPYSDLLATPGPDGSGLWSRYPLTKQAAWPLRFQAPGAVVHVPGQDLVVRVVHAYPPVGQGPGSFRGDLQQIVTRAHALPRDTPAIVLGDFNATLDTSFLRSLTDARYGDAGELAGSGFQRTWGPRATAVLDLDHVFVDRRKIGVRGTEVVDLPGSDHDGVIARIVLA